MTLTFRLRERPDQAIDISILRPDHLYQLSLAEIAALPLWQGNRRRRVADLFELDGEIEPTSKDDTVVINNACSRLDGIGADMRQGSISVSGDAGAYLGRNMRGGNIDISGQCGAFAGAGLCGGRIVINGDAGDFLGAALTGERIGMRGGLILVRGNAGDRAGDRLRRGALLIAGNAGDYCASRMIAGTLAVLGDIGYRPGFGMRRGTLLLAKAPVSLPATFSDNGVRELTFLPLLTASFTRLERRFGALAALGNRVHRFVGDRACGGKGEILMMPDS